MFTISHVFMFKYKIITDISSKCKKIPEEKKKDSCNNFDVNIECCT